ncbi:MAG: hypothetical protein KAS86_02355, partial [Candidatus Omnitrophica bacterium]|nr:hypothetical protein [Candidatus Omnitrophota bacterium]
HPVRVKTMSFNESKQEGALSFFGEKYGDTVRMVSIGDVSKELCGGTHVRNTAEIGLVKILNESSVASGTRRVEAVSGDGARSWLKGALEDALREHEAVPGDLLKMYLNEEPGSAPDVKKALSMARGICAADIAIDRKVLRDYEDTIKPVFVKIKEYADRAGKKRRKAEEADTFTGLKSELDRILREKSTADGVGFVGAVFEDVEMPALRKALTHAGKKAGSGIILLGGRKAGRASLICAVTADLTERGFSARDIIDKIAGNIEGRGGGTDTFAQAGGKKPEGLTSAVDEGRRMIAEKARQ